MGPRSQVTPEIIALTLWYSVAAVGIAIVNDFKSVEGDLVWQNSMDWFVREIYRKTPMGFSCKFPPKPIH